MKYLNGLTFLLLAAALLIMSGCTCSTRCTSEPMASYRPAIALRDIHFSFASAELTPTAKKTLREDVENMSLMDPSSRAKIVLEGRADERGAAGYNKQLSSKRIAAVKSYLKSLGATEAQFESRALGESSPVESGSNPEAWAKNRSVRVLAM